MYLIDRLPGAHADVSAQGRLSDVLPFIAVAVPLNEGLRERRASGRVDHMPGSHDSLAGTFTLKMAYERPLLQRQGIHLLRRALVTCDAWIHARCMCGQSERERSECHGSHKNFFHQMTPSVRYLGFLRGTVRATGRRLRTGGS